MLTYHLDPQAKTPLYEQLYRAIRADILSGALPGDARLPAKRRLAEHLEISRNYLSTLFQTILHTSPSEYLANFRLTRAKEQLTITALPIGTIASMCGYRDPLVFSKAFKLKTGMTPSQYRKTTREIQHMSIEQMRRKKQF